MSKKVVRLFAGPLIALLGFSVPTSAQDHLVSPADVSARLAAAVAERRGNLTTLDAMVCSAAGRQTVSRLGGDVEQVRVRIASLSDAEARDLAGRVRALRTDPAAGGLSNKQITWIVIGGVFFVLLTVAVAVAVANDPYYDY